MPESMHPVGQSFTELMDLCGAHFGKRLDTTAPASRSSNSLGSSSQDDLLLMLARLTLRQEYQLNQLALDRSFVMFLQCGKGSVMPLMLQTSKEWHV